MDSRRSRIWPAISLVTLSLCASTEAKTSPLSLTPSTSWYGDAGSWSAVSIQVGDPVQDLDVMVSTASSEVIVVSSTACTTDQCAMERGGTFDTNLSKTWSGQGIASLGLDVVLGEEVNGSIGWDTLSYGTAGISVASTRVASFNSTVFPLGFIGLGVSSSTSSTSNGIDAKSVSMSVPLSPISQLVETMSEIPSHSYGYTAGASYRNTDGCPNSVTFGGRDTHRYVDNTVSFELSTKQQPSMYINSLYLSLPGGTPTPPNWASSSPKMLVPKQQVTVLVDSSTPYLWLPQAVCESFAAALNLTYNETLNLYTFDGNEAQHRALQALSFSVSLEISAQASSIETVTIELPYQAFDQQMTSPETKNYFPLKQAANASQYTLGRTFLQEAYIIVDYERGNFSVHQALFPLNATTDTSGIVIITRPADSSFTGPNDYPGGDMSKAAIAGIVIGSLALLVLLIVANVYRIRYNRLRALQNTRIDHEKPSTKNGLLLAKLRIGDPHTSNFNNGPRATIYETEGNSAFPVEIGAIERFEMAAPMTPVELDSDSSAVHHSPTDTHLSEYERQRMRQQLAMRGGHMGDASFPDNSDLNTYDGGTYRSEISTVSALSTNPRSTLLDALSPVSELRDPPPSYQRNVPNIIPEGTRMVFAGNIPHISPGMEVGFLPDHRADLEASLGSGTQSLMFGGSNRDTLGSNYTVEEARTLDRMREMEGEREYLAMINLMRSPGGQVMPILENRGRTPSPHPSPQAEPRRFSWEEV